MEYERCYSFAPSQSRPAKRRRVEGHGLHASWPLRERAYQDAWQSLEADVNARLDSINTATLEEVANFIDEVATSPPEYGRTPAAFILAGPYSGLHNTLTAHLTSDAARAARQLYVPVSSGAGSNLKTLLKSIIRTATSQSHDDDDDDPELAPTGQRGPRLLNYDLQILYDHCQERQVRQVIISIQDTEAFDSQLLSELIQLITCWQDRFATVLIFNVATSVEFLQQRLPQKAVQCIHGRAFDSALLVDEVDQVLEAITSPDIVLWMGPKLSAMLLERQQDYTQSIDTLVDSIRYAYMSSFYANALTIFMASASAEEVPRDHFEALRNLDSFRAFAEGLLASGDAMELRDVLDSDQVLFAKARDLIASGQQALLQAAHATEVIRSIQRCLPDVPISSKTNLYIQMMSGKLAGSPLIRSLLLSARKAPSNIVLDLMQNLVELNVPQDIKDQGIAIYESLEALVRSSEASGNPLRSEDDVRNSTLRTTVVAQKVELSKQKSALSKEDAAYTALLRQFTDLLDAYFSETLVNPDDLALHEIFVYDLKSPHREVLMPRPRHAIERALATPHDYLDCACCAPDAGASGTNGDEATLAASQPPTALLYQLYLESGNLINVNDLWRAYQALLGDEDEQRAVGLFQRGMAELRYLGMIKSTRRRVDHVAKVIWKGL